MVPEEEAKLLRLLRTMLALTPAPAREGGEAAVGARAGLAEGAAQHLAHLLGHAAMRALWASLGRAMRLATEAEGLVPREAVRALGGPRSSNVAAASVNVSALVTRFMPAVQAFFVAQQARVELDEAAAMRAVAEAEPAEKPATEQQPGQGQDVAQKQPEQQLAQQQQEKQRAQAASGESSWAAEAAEGARELAHFARRHSTLLNQLIRVNPRLLRGEKPPMWAMLRLGACGEALEFDNKCSSFREQLARRGLRPRRENGVLNVRVRRSDVLGSSFQQLGHKSARAWRGKLSVEFEGEPGLDAGGLTREWFSLLGKAIFNPNYGLFITSADSSTYQPNPTSGANREHLSYFQFVGRVIGRALCDGHHLDAYFTRSFYKHILGRPVVPRDLEAVDPQYYRGLMQLLEHPLEDLYLDLTFSAELEEFGERRVVDLVPNGRSIAVTDENKGEYVRLITQHRLTSVIEDQLVNFKQGLHELVPADLIGMFNEQEFELLIAGMPTVDSACFAVFYCVPVLPLLTNFPAFPLPS